MRLTAGVFFCFMPQATDGGRGGLFVDIDPIPPNANLGERPDLAIHVLLGRRCSSRGHLG
jgi:hypothetical protein